MAYNKQKLFEQEEQDIPKMGVMEGLQYFTKENKFKNEKEFVSSLLSILKELIYKIYKYDIDKIELEKTYDLRKYELPSQRIDIFCTTKQVYTLFIECKNPTNNYGELNLSLGQMLNYQMIIESINKPTKLIFASSLFHFYIAKVIKRFSLNYDIVLHNKKTTMFLLNSELCRK